MSKQEIPIFLEKIRKLVDVEECKDSDYERVPVSEGLKNKIYEEQKGLCWLCKCQTTTPVTHHIKPDGESVRENLVMLCSLCHQFTHWILKKYLDYRGMRGRSFLFK